VAWQLVTAVADPDTLMDEALRMADALAARSPAAVAATRALLLDTPRHDLEAQMELEGRAISRSAASVPGRQGLRDFVERHGDRRHRP
jgi:enoyl-CoA hydratase/carnithine racemase